MIKASFEGKDGRRHYVFALSYMNLERLRKDNPTQVDLAEVGGEGTVLIFAGETEGLIEEMLREHGFIGPETNVAKRPRP